MEAGAALLLLLGLLRAAEAASFYGDSVSLMPPHKKADGTFELAFYHRQNGRSSCQDQSSFTCDGGACTDFKKLSVLQTDRDQTGHNRWCQLEGHTTATVQTSKTSFTLMNSGCCWESNVEGKTKWTSHTEVDLGTRSDSHSLNSCPVTATVSSLRVPQNCFSRIHLLAHDPDRDEVRCSYAPNATAPSNFTLHESSCTLTASGALGIGVHVFEVMLEDFSTKNITVTYADGSSVFRDASDQDAPPLCRVTLQFSVEILAPIATCEAGHSQPMFLSRTPSHGEVLHATVGQPFQLFAEAQAHHTSIRDFQVSGPQNMTKVFKDGTSGKAEVILNWTPKMSDLYRFVPVCFTAETNETQSEMRCVVVMVTQASVVQGKATVKCLPNKMTVVLDKSSMPGIDENFLELRDPSCSLTANGTHIMGTMSFSTCGTKLEDKGDFIVFGNQINSFVLPSEVIVRRETVRIDFSCQFPKTISISSYYTLHKSDYIFTESSFGSFGYTFEIFTNNNFTTRVEPSAYPVEVKLLETVYMGIQANSELPNVTLFVESCKATPEDKPDSIRFYDLIKNGCLEDETVKVYPSVQTAYHFEVQAFKFTGNFDQVYITCSVILCEPGNPFSRCAQGCLSEPARRRRRGLSKETVRHYITQGPLQFVRTGLPSAAEIDQAVLMKQSNVAAAPFAPAAPAAAPAAPAAPAAAPGAPFAAAPHTRSSSDGWAVKQFLSSNITTIVFASAFLVSVVMLAVLVGYYSRRRKEEDCRALVVSEWDD